MKTLLNTFIFLLSLALATAAFGSTDADSLVVQFGNRTKVVIQSEDKTGEVRLSNAEVVKIITDLGMKVDSAASGETFLVVDDNNQKQYLRDTVLVITRQRGGVSIIVKDPKRRSSSDNSRLERRNDNDSNSDTDRDYRRERRRRENWGIGIEGFGLGLNTLIEKTSNPLYPSERYDLRPLGSRYFSIGLGQMPTIARGRHASLRLYYGLELAWNNFMFDGDNLIQKSPTGITFPEAGQSLKKSKFTTCTIGIPFVPRLSFYNNSNHKVFHIGVGAYANYRVDSYSKIKLANNDKQRDHSNFYLNDFRYGLMVHLGLAKTNFFVKYDLQPLFKQGLGPDVRAISFGIGL